LTLWYQLRYSDAPPVAYALVSVVSPISGFYRIRN